MPPLPPSLPRGWTAHLSRDGTRYFYANSVDSVTTWAVPDESMAVETDLPLGWTPHRAKDGQRFFYWCEVSKQTMWEV